MTVLSQPISGQDISTNISLLGSVRKSGSLKTTEIQLSQHIIRKKVWIIPITIYKKRMTKVSQPLLFSHERSFFHCPKLITGDNVATIYQTVRFISCCRCIFLHSQHTYGMFPSSRVRRHQAEGRCDAWCQEPCSCRLCPRRVLR